MDRGLYDGDHEAFRETVRAFVAAEVTPKLARWDSQRLIDRDTWRAAGRQGIVGLSGPAEFGGGDMSDYRFRNVIMEELARVGAGSLMSSFSLHDDIVMPLLHGPGHSSSAGPVASRHVHRPAHQRPSP